MPNRNAERELERDTGISTKRKKVWSTSFVTLAIWFAESLKPAAGFECSDKKKSNHHGKAKASRWALIFCIPLFLLSSTSFADDTLPRRQLDAGIGHFKSTMCRPPGKIEDLNKPAIKAIANKIAHAGNSTDIVIFRDIKKSAKSSPLPPGTPRILVYMTTACSSCQLKHLQGCWPNSMEAAPLLSQADVLLFAGCSNIVARGTQLWVRALSSLPNANVSLAWMRNNPGYQQGAIYSVVLATRLGWFGEYDWVIRVNPDVVFENAMFLEAHLWQSNTSAVLSQCRTRVRGPAGLVIHTDFFAARPLAMDNTKWKGHVNAEVASTHVFKSIVDSQRAVVFQKGTSNYQCRVMNNGIVHQHDFCSIKPPFFR